MCNTVPARRNHRQRGSRVQHAGDRGLNWIGVTTVPGSLGRAGRTTGPLGLPFGPAERCGEPLDISFGRMPKHGPMVCQRGPASVRPKRPAVRPARVVGPGEGTNTSRQAQRADRSSND
jgi:hypothetical protein